MAKSTKRNVAGAAMELTVEAASRRIGEDVLSGHLDRFLDRGTRTLNTESTEQLSILSKWIRQEINQQRHDLSSWPSTSESLKSLGSFMAACCAVKELDQDLHPLVDSTVLECLPSKAQVLELFKTCPWLPGNDKHSIPEDEPSESDRELFSRLAVFSTLCETSRYNILFTPSTVLVDVQTQLESIAFLVDSIIKRSPRNYVLLGVRGLLHFQQGRIARALGGKHLASANSFFNSALDCYEVRAVEKSHEAKCEADRLIAVQFSSYRAALVMLQKSYLSFLRGQLTRAMSQLREAKLFALYCENSILTLEIDLVELSIARAQLSLDDLESLEGIACQLEKNAAAQELLQRDAYMLMALYQAGLCRTVTSRNKKDGPEYPALIAAESILRIVAQIEKRQSAQRNTTTSSIVYWRASAYLLELFAAVNLARRCDTRSVSLRTSLLDIAGKAGRRALSVLTQQADVENLRVTCELHLTEALILTGEYDQARAHLQRALTSDESAGFASNPFAAATHVLLRAELALGLHDAKSAWVALHEFESIYAAHVQFQWLRERFQTLEREVRASGQLFLITDRDVAADQAKSGTGNRKLTFRQLQAQLESFIVESTLRIHGPVSLERLKELTGLGRNKVIEVRKRLRITDAATDTIGEG